MKKFLVKLALFLLPIVVLAYAADAFISRQLRNSNGLMKGEIITWRDLYDGNVNSEILIMGSSRAWVHFDAKMIGDSLHTHAYNLGIDGYNFAMQNYRFQLAMRQKVKPKVVIQSIDVFTLARRADLWSSEQFLPFMLGNNELQEATNHYIGFKPYDFHVPMMRYYGRGKAILEAFELAAGGKNQVTRIRGFQGQLIPWTNDLELARKRMGRFTVKMEAESIALFESYLHFCQKNGIQVVFVYTPEFIEGQEFIANREEMMGIYRKLSVKYHIPFLDYSTHALSYQKQYFYNALHMNKFGAEAFTAAFIQDLRKLHLKF